MAQSQGLGAFQPVDDQNATRFPDAITRQLSTRDSLTLIVTPDAQQGLGIADQIDGGDDEDTGRKPSYLRGDFDANLAEEMTYGELSMIASRLLEGIEADLSTRKQWEKIAERALEFLGLIFEEASGVPQSEGSISKVWHTLMLEATINFWANAYAEFLPADGPVKVRDDKPPQPATLGAGDNGGPPLDDAQQVPRDELAEAFEADFNHFLTVVDRQYYPDFSRMLMSLGPIGTEFRKVYRNPLRRNMAVSEWVKSTDLIVSNDAMHLTTAGRVTQRIMMNHAQVKRMEYLGCWVDYGMPVMQPDDTPTDFQKKVGEIEGIKPGAELPADHRHTVYESYCEWDLPGYEHTDDGEETGLPLPYRITVDKDSRRVKEIRRNWKEGDEEFEPRQRYIMFGMVPGFGFYALGFAHILGNTERALTALEREVIDAGMLSIFPGNLAAKGALPRGTTQIAIGPMGVQEVDLQMKQRIQDAIMPMPYKELSPTVMALIEKLEDNGRKLAAAIELKVGEGTADIPVGTMIAMIEQSTKVMAAVHKGLHSSRAQELELLKELIAEDPTQLSKFNKSPAHQWEEAEEFADIDLVPSSDPNTPSHIHRVMKALGLSQVAQQFPDLANRAAIFKRLLDVLQEDNPEQYINPNPQVSPPNPQAIAAQAKIQTAQIQAQGKQADLSMRAQQGAAEEANKLKIATMGEQTERLKTAAEIQSDQARQHDSAAERAQDTQTAREGHMHDAATQLREHAHEARQSTIQQGRDAAMQQQQPPAAPKRTP